jgi:RNA polymerase sigma-70 factor (ECF subfamily)
MRNNRQMPKGVRAMVSTIASLATQTVRTRPANSVPSRSQHRFSTAPTLEEAYEMRLLGEVARWDEQAAFEEIYTRHHKAVVGTALQICQDRGAAEEIAQQTFTALWIRADRLIEKSVRLRPWLTTVARNAAIDHVRAQKHVAALDEAAAIASTAQTPEDAAIASAGEAELGAALATLSAEQRAAIELVHIAGMTYAAAANMLGEPVGTIKSRVHLALGHLRAQIMRSER